MYGSNKAVLPAPLMQLLVMYGPIASFNYCFCLPPLS